MPVATRGRKLTIPYIFVQMLFNAAYCGIAGYASAFLLNAGFSNTEIGTITTVSLIAGLVIQPLIGDLVDNNPAITEKRINIFMFALAGGCAAILMAINAKMVVGVLYVVMVCALSLEIALSTSLAFAHISLGRNINFSLARGFGSVGYSIASYGLGIAAAAFSPDIVIPISIAVCVIAIVVLMLFPEITREERLVVEKVEAKEPSGDDNENLIEFCKRNPRFMLYIISVLLVFFSHMIHATFWFQYIENIGGTVDQFGTMAAVCALLEFPAMAVTPWLMRHFKLKPLMVVSAAFFVVKILCLGFSPTVPIMYSSAIMQMFSFALFTPVSSYYANAVTTIEENNKAQSILNFGREGATIFAAMVGGIMLDMGGYFALTMAAAVVSAIGTVMMAIVAPKVPEGKEYMDQVAAEGVDGAEAMAA